MIFSKRENKLRRKIHKLQAKGKDTTELGKELEYLLKIRRMKEDLAYNKELLRHAYGEHKTIIKQKIQKQQEALDRLKQLTEDKSYLKIKLNTAKIQEKLMKATPSKGIIVASVVGSITLLYGISGLNQLDPGEIGIQTQQYGNGRGMLEQTLGGGKGGTFWVDPITFDVNVYDVKFRQYILEDVRVETRDGQPIALDISFEIGLTGSLVPTLHQTVGPGWYDEIVLPSARAAIRDASSAQKSSEIYTATGRKAMRMAIEKQLQPLRERGINFATNIRRLEFLNPEFVATLEQKSIAAEKEEIERRLAKAAVQTAVRVANKAEGEKQRTIKEAEAANESVILAADANKQKVIAQAEGTREQMRLEGEGLRLKQTEQAKGILEIGKANAESTRLMVRAYGSGAVYANVQWAQNLGPNVKVYGVPTGSPGTSSIVDLNGVLKGALGGMTK